MATIYQMRPIARGVLTRFPVFSDVAICVSLVTMPKTLVPVVVLGCGLLAHGFVAAAAPRTSLRGTRQSQILQNERADRDHLSRMTNQETLQRFKRLELVVAVPAKTRDYYIHSIPAQYHYLRPWSKLFLDRLSSQFRRRFGRPLRITSLIRTSGYQNQLSRLNGNAAAAVGKKRSSHLTGASLDISKKGMTAAQKRWVRNVLASIKAKGYLFAVEEFYQPNFHVMVYRNYPEYVAMLQARRKKR